MDNYTIKGMIADYERDLLGNWYTLHLSNGDVPSFAIESKNIPHLLGVRKLPLRQVQGKSALSVYEMLKRDATEGRFSCRITSEALDDYCTIVVQ